MNKPHNLADVLKISPWLKYCQKQLVAFKVIGDKNVYPRNIYSSSMTEKTTRNQYVFLCSQYFSLNSVDCLLALLTFNISFKSLC